jgi:hypothetical protein
VVRFECEDGFSGYSLGMPLLGLVGLRHVRIQAFRMTRIRRWVIGFAAIATTLLAVAALVGFALDPLFTVRYRNVVGSLAILISASLALHGSHTVPTRMVERSRCRAVGLAPPLLMIEWFLRSAPLAIGLWLMAAPFAAVPFLRSAGMLLVLVLIALTLLPFANAAVHQVQARRKRARMQTFRVVERD